MTEPPYGTPEQPPGPEGYPVHPGAPGVRPPAYPQQLPQQWGQPYAAPYGYGPPMKKSNTTRNVLLVVGLVILLVCGGAAAGLVALVRTTSSSFDHDYRGSEKDPLTITAGDAFEIRGMSYSAGWGLSAGPDAIGRREVKNERAEKDSTRSSLTFTLLDGDRILDQFECYSGATISYGRTALLDCTSLDEPLPDYTSLEVYDNSYYE
ncbi:hypothetical protein BH11ACT8_BH11ACT8_24950 [soil metagenome]